MSRELRFVLPHSTRWTRMGNAIRRWWREFVRNNTVRDYEGDDEL